MNKYAEKDMVDVVDEQGNDLPSVPKAWVGTDLMPPGVTKKSSRSSSSTSTSGSGSSGSGSKPARQPGEKPAGNASREEWAAFATEKGAKAEDLVDADGKDLGRDELREKYSTPAS